MKKSIKSIIGQIWLLFLLFFYGIKGKKTHPQWPKQFFILGHRGCRAVAPENTLSSFKMAIEHGAKGVEFDITLSKDLVPVVIHDDTLERTTNGHGLVGEYTAQELSNLDATKVMPLAIKEGVPSLKETLNALPNGSIANIELKNSKFSKALFIEKVWAVAKEHENRLIILFSSFDGELLSILRTIHPNAIICLLLSQHDSHWLTSLLFWQKISPNALHLPKSLAKPFILKAAAWAQLPIAIWTVNDPYLALYYYQKKIAGIFTDDVNKIRGCF
jgi:glycerophosphoryl diester phosphodiesterase